LADVTKAELSARLKLTRNGLTLYDQRFYSGSEDFDESTHQRVVLATNMATSQEIDMTNITTGTKLMLQTTRAIKVAVDAVGAQWDVAANGAVLLTGSFTHVYVKNESTTNTATIEAVVTDS
jgi:hypothetical protein